MTGYQLIAIQNNLIFRAPLWDSHHFAATPGVIYQVVDIKTGLPLEVRTLKTEEDLEVWKDDELLLVLDGYFQQDMDARFEERQPLLETGPFEEAGELVALDAEGNPVAEGTFSWLANAGYLAAGVVGMQAMAIGGSDELPDVTRDVTVTPLAGPFIAEVDVKIYDADGHLMGTGSVDESTGQVTITISNGYVGPILVVVTDINGSDADYISEATGEATSLNGSLRAMMEVTGDGDVSLSVTPLTELAVQLAGVPDTTAELASSPVTSEQVATNDSVEELLGVSDILGEATTVVDDDFNADDGLDDAETYGDMLAIFSGAEEDLGGIQASVEALAAEITITEGTAQLSAAGASILQSGWQTFESGSNADLVETQSLVADMPLIAESQFGMLLNEASDGTTIKVNGVSEGDVIHTSLGSTSVDYTVTAEMLDGDVASVFIDTATLQAAGDGELELQVQVNDETPRQPILLEQDLTPPEVLITLASSSLAVGETTQVTFTFSEAVEGFSADDVEVDNGTLTALTSSEDGLTWTALYVPDSDVENAAANISVLPAFTDLLGNAPASFTPAGGANPVAAQSAVSVDTSRPTALISLSDTDLALGETATVTISFSEAIAGFSLDDIEVDLALLSNLSSADGGTTWTATLTPQDGFESASNSVRLGIGWTDAAGNQPLVFYTSESYQVDTAAPRIDNSSYFSLAENSGAGQTLLTVSATDLQAVTWTLEGDHASAFSYNSSTGAVSLNDDPDYETLSLYQLTLVATDASGNRSEHSVVLEITDVDDSAPVFDSGDSARTIDENGPAEVVYTASTDDPNATFTLSGTDAAFFSLNGADVTFAGSANYETKDSYQFSITATDAAGNSSTQTVTMVVNDLDEVAPVFTSGTTATAVDENGPATVVYTATSDDASVTYSLSGTDAAAFSIADGVVTFNGNADYETQSSYSFTVTATDAAGNSSTQTVTMAVNDLDDTAPVFTSGTTATAVD
ncbi:MAG: Ig-like domain-containing protein, partial [Oceanobacter sp.]